MSAPEIFGKVGSVIGIMIGLALIGLVVGGVLGLLIFGLKQLF